MKLHKVQLLNAETIPGIPTSSQLTASGDLGLDFEQGLLRVTRGETVCALIPAANVRWMIPAPKK